MQASPPRRTPVRRGSVKPTSNQETSSNSHMSVDTPNKQAATFTSCLSIPVEGAISIETLEAQTAASQSSTASSSSSDSKRAPRKSKTEAIAALHNHSLSSAGQDGDLNDSIYDDAGIRIQLRDGPPIAVSPTLDMSSVKTPNPRNSPSRPRERLFGLTDCPTFRPTPEQFKDPMAYIKSISENARTYGMCKIIPPLGWDMPFVTDTEVFRFKTRLQRLNSIEASSRAKVNFLEQLYRFHKQQGNPRVSVPTINHKPLDLWLLRKEVIKLGGYDNVTRTKKWADLGRLLGYGGIPGLSTQMKNSYARVILPYEQFCDRVRNSPRMNVDKPRDPQLKTHINIQMGGKLHSSSNGHGVDDSPPSSPLTATSSPLSEPPDESDLKEANGHSKLRRSTRQSSQEQQTPARRTSNANDSQSASISAVRPLNELKPGQPNPELHCEVCQKKDRGEEMLLCDGCDCGFHTFCLDPPLQTIPKGQWFCHICLFGTGGDFGFDEGEEHSLSSFQARDNEFRRLWFKSHPPSRDDRDRIHDIDPKAKTNTPDPAVNRFGDIEVTETDVEHEFWRLVQSQYETVEVEYGADVHSTTHGSGMPTLETHPLNPYSKDPWNLNNIPILPESLLRFIKSDISGMTVPWTYVGMVFSTFCWHNEDHYTYSINYMHWGETKTWYSVPGDDADKFEAAIRKEAPDLFEAQPDLLFQLVTLMNPKRIKDGGLDVYACNQRAGELVITFPKAYHAGFNHGFNFNEAVNFALPGWLPYGLDCVRRYQEHRKLPVFSHDELLITITQQSQSIKTALWLNQSLQEMTEREMETRSKARFQELGEVIEEVDRPEDQYQCHICKAFCYLSQITCQCTTKIVCIDHIELLCKCPKTNLVLRKRFSDMELQDIQMKVSERAAIPTLWRAKLNKLLTESARPPLRALRTLLAEGDRISYPLSELHSLRKCVNRANDWVDTANSFIIRKPIRKRPRRSRGRVSGEGSSGGVGEDVVDRPDRGLDDLYTLLKQVSDLGFDCPEITSLRNLAADAEETKAKARALLDACSPNRDRDAYIQECERLIAHASGLNLQIDEINEAEKIVMREQLLKELEEETDDATLTLEDVRQFVQRGRACNLSTENKYMKRLEIQLRLGEQWEGRVKAVLAKSHRTLDELEEYSSAPSDVPVDPALQESIASTFQRAQEVEKQAMAWLMPEPGALKPRVSDVVKLVTRAEKEFNLPVIIDLRRTVDFAVDLEKRCENVLRNRYHHTDDGDIFNTMLSWRTYAKEHLSMFSMPHFERLDKQLTQHFRWLEGLPWYCRQHHAAHGKPILDDVVESTRPEDDLPPNDEFFTCICTIPVRPPAPGTVSDAVQCDHCFARFHGLCAANGGSCPFCDHQHWNGTLHKDRSWHFCYLPTILLNAPDVTKNYSEDWKHLEIIVHHVDRLSTVIGQFLSFASQPANQRAEYLPQVRHYMRKLYKIQFAVSPIPEVSFGLDLAGLHRILAGQPQQVRQKKRRRPKFIFGQDVDKDWQDGTRCICRGRTGYLLNYPTVECEACNKLYHAGCVFYPIDPNAATNRFVCPLCCLRKNRNYLHSEVRVKHIDNPEPETYVDTKEMLDTFSKDIIYMKLPPPFQQTLFVELIRFAPGQPDTASSGPNGGRNAPTPSSGLQTSQVPPPLSSTNGAPPPAPRAVTLPHLHPHPQAHPHVPGPQLHGPSHAIPYGHPHGPPYGPPRAGKPLTPPTYPSRLPPPPPPPAGPSVNVPPPPPWTNRSSRWSNAAATAPPPSSARSQPPEHGSPLMTPQLQPRKRKYPEEGSPVTEESAPSGASPHVPSPKRFQTPVMQPARTNQGLSPSLAMMLSPTPVEVRVSPRQPPTAPPPLPPLPPPPQANYPRSVPVMPATMSTSPTRRTSDEVQLQPSAVHAGGLPHTGPRQLRVIDSDPHSETQRERWAPPSSSSGPSSSSQGPPRW